MCQKRTSIKEPRKLHEMPAPYQLRNKDKPHSHGRASAGTMKSRRFAALPFELARLLQT
jgi:hypothetical protein